MTVLGTVLKGAYYDSVTLMIVSKQINELEGVADSAVVMGSSENKDILEAAGLMTPALSSSAGTDLLISIKARSEELARQAIGQAETLLGELTKKQESRSVSAPRSLTKAVEQLKGANLALISVAGKYAARECREALDNGLHVMLFSDNVGIEDERALKTYAKSKGLLLMGPDCGSAIINGVPLAFANVVHRGDIGIVAASGTGLQEVSSLIDRHGCGISQAIGTGGRDVKKEIGGIMFVEALKALNEDHNTHCIVLISKPPDAGVLDRIAAEIRSVSKPVVGLFIGGDSKMIRRAGALPATSLEEAARMACHISMGKADENTEEWMTSRAKEIAVFAARLPAGNRGRYLRGLYSGGTLCDEAQLLLMESLGHVYSNTPLHPGFLLADPWEGKEHTILDMGEDDFTRGRPHPMIDFSLRNKKIHEEASDPEVAVILFDLVLGYGAHPSPAAEIIPAIRDAKELSPNLLFICSVTGTDQDPQNRKKVVQEIEKEGVFVMPSNGAAALLAGEIIRNIAK